MVSLLLFVAIIFLFLYFPIEYVDVLVGGDNLSLHYSDINLRESRMLCKIVKIAWAFTSGGCIDVVAGPDNNMVK